MTTTRLTASLVSVSLAFALAACDRRDETAQRNPEPATVGQKLDSAIDRTQQKIADAGEKASQQLSDAGDKTMQKLSEAGQKTEQALTTAGEKIAAKTNEAVGAVNVSDAAITASIKTDFLKDPDLSVLKIDVDTKGGVVTLNGLAADEPARQRAEKMANAVKGVKEVRNFLVVKRA